MKKILSFAACAALICSCLASCEKPHEEGEDPEEEKTEQPGGEKPVEPQEPEKKKELSPDEQKAKIQEICENTLALIDSEDYRSSVELAVYFIDNYFDYAVDEIDEFGDRVLTSTTMLTIPEFYATFKANTEKKAWELVKRGGGAIVLNFPGPKGEACSLTLKATGSSYGCAIDDEMSMRLPQKIEFNIAGSGNAKAEGVIELGYKSGSSAEVKIEAELAGSVTMNVDVSVDSKGVNGSFSIIAHETEAVSGTFTSSIKFPVIEDGKDVDEYLNNLSVSELFVIDFEIEVYRSMQVRGSVNTAFSSKLEDIYEKQLSAKEEARQIAEVLNKYVDAGVYYSSEVLQARIQFEPYVYKGDGYEYGDVIPVLFFPHDETIYELDDYFTEESFSSLIDSFEKLVESFVELFASLDA